MPQAPNEYRPMLYIAHHEKLPTGSLSYTSTRVAAQGTDDGR
jgi:hypothetical protein